MQAIYGPLVRQIGPFYSLGEMAMLHRGSAPITRTATAVASEATTTLVVSQATYNAVLRTRREVSMRARLNLLGHADPGASLPPKVRRSVAFALTPESVGTGKVFTRQGSPFGGLLVIAEGCLAVLRQGCCSMAGSVDGGHAAGKHQEGEDGVYRKGGGGAVDTVQLIDRRGPGQMAGEDGLFNEGVHDLTIVAEVPSKVYRLAPQVRPCLSLLFTVMRETVGTRKWGDRLEMCPQKDSFVRFVRRGICIGRASSNRPTHCQIQCGAC
jgi:CRP-like cAMP-binding protein